MDLVGKMRGESKNVLLVPNIRDEAGLEGFSGIELYKQRVLSCINGNDFAIMPESTKNGNETLSNIYNDYKIDFIKPENIFYIDGDSNISSETLKNIKDISKSLNGKVEKLFPFINSKEIDLISEKLGIKSDRDFNSSEIINDKSQAQEELRNLGVSTPEGKSVFNEQEAIKYFKYLQEKGFKKSSFKLKRAASGMGVFQINSMEELKQKLEEYKDHLEEGILMDGWIEGNFISSPNIQYYVGKTEKDDIFIGASNQILLDGKIHLGNISDSEIMKNEKLKNDLKIIRNWIRSKKAYGISGLDFSIYEENGKQVPYFMEINGRINGSTHGNIIANKIYGEDYHDSWAVLNNVKLPKNMSLNDFILKLEKDKISYNPSTKSGVIITNISTIETENKIMVTVVGKDKNKILETVNILNSYKY